MCVYWQRFYNTHSHPHIFILCVSLRCSVALHTRCVCLANCTRPAPNFWRTIIAITYCTHSHAHTSRIQSGSLRAQTADTAQHRQPPHHFSWSVHFIMMFEIAPQSRARRTRDTLINFIGHSGRRTSRPLEEAEAKICDALSACAVGCWVRLLRTPWTRIKPDNSARVGIVHQSCVMVVGRPTRAHMLYIVCVWCSGCCYCYCCCVYK